MSTGLQIYEAPQDGSYIRTTESSPTKEPDPDSYCGSVVKAVIIYGILLFLLMIGVGGLVASAVYLSNGLYSNSSLATGFKIAGVVVSSVLIVVVLILLLIFCLYSYCKYRQFRKPIEVKVRRAPARVVTMQAVVQQPVVVKRPRKIKELHYYGDDSEPTEVREFVAQVPIHGTMPVAISMPVAVQPAQIAALPNKDTKVVRVVSAKKSIRERLSDLVRTTEGKTNKTSGPLSRYVINASTLTPQYQSQQPEPIERIVITPQQSLSTNRNLIIKEAP